MWKRINNSRGARQPTISAPSPIDATFDENLYAGSRDSGVVNRKQLPPDRNRPPPRPPREDMAPKGLPRLPFQPGPPLRKPSPPSTSPTHEDSTLRPASSLYSQPSPAPIVTRFPQNQYAANYNAEEEVSPPSSPEFGTASRSQAHANAEDDEVSPVDEMPDISALGLQRPPSRTAGTNPPSSSIPVLRREKKRLAAAAAIANRKEVGGPKGRQAVDPRWDPYSGEITTSDRGKPQSVKPGQFSALGLRPIHKETGITLGTETSISGGKANHTSFGDRVRKLKIQTPAEKPEWKGATGRTTLVSPVSDQPHIAPLNIPPKSIKRVTSPVSSSHSGSDTPVTMIRSGDGETSPVSPEHAQYTSQNIRPVLPKTDNISPHFPIDVAPDPHVVNQSAAARTFARGNDRPIEVQTPPRSKPAQFESPPTTIERNFREALKDSFPVPSDPYVQPPSRFSVTTYAPSEVQSTPRPSMDSFEPMPQQTPVINRKRPTVVDSSPQMSKITRKAVAPPGSPVFISMTSSIPGSRRTSNIAKNLPMSPAEAASQDLVTSLQAQLDNLAHRRQNITRSIRQMTELMPKDNVLITEEVRIKREMEKMKVERLRVEEADVRREEHEIGLRLHRAWKRRDKDAVFEPTGLWVRRVTGVGRNWAVLRPDMTV